MNQFDIDFEKFIHPYNVENGIDSAKVKESTKNQYNFMFEQSKVEFVYYETLEWYDQHKYVKGKEWHNAPHKYLGYTDMQLFKCFVADECQRRATQIIELCCDLYKNSVNVYPVYIWPSRVHPGNTLMNSLIWLNKPCCVIRVVPQFFNDNGKVLKTIKSLQDIQDIYADKKLYAFFVGKEKHHGLQCMVKHGNFNRWDPNGYLRWDSDVPEDRFRIDLFLERLQKHTQDLDGEKVSIPLNVKYQFQKFEITIPNSKEVENKIMFEMFEWGSNNL